MCVVWLGGVHTLGAAHSADLDTTRTFLLGAPALPDRCVPVHQVRQQLALPVEVLNGWAHVDRAQRRIASSSQHPTQHAAHSTQHTSHSKQHKAHSTHRRAHSTQHTAHSTQHRHSMDPVDRAQHRIASASQHPISMHVTPKHAAAIRHTTSKDYSRYLLHCRACWNKRCVRVGASNGGLKVTQCHSPNGTP